MNKFLLFPITGRGSCDRHRTPPNAREEGRDVRGCRIAAVRRSRELRERQGERG